MGTTSLTAKTFISVSYYEAGILPPSEREKRKITSHLHTMKFHCLWPFRDQEIRLNGPVNRWCFQGINTLVTSHVASQDPDLQGFRGDCSFRARPESSGVPPPAQGPGLEPFWFESGAWAGWRGGGKDIFAIPMFIALFAIKVKA